MKIPYFIFHSILDRFEHFFFYFMLPFEEICLKHFVIFFFGLCIFFSHSNCSLSLASNLGNLRKRRIAFTKKNFCCSLVPNTKVCLILCFSRSFLVGVWFLFEIIQCIQCFVSNFMQSSYNFYCRMFWIILFVAFIGSIWFS